MKTEIPLQSRPAAPAKVWPPVPPPRKFRLPRLRLNLDLSLRLGWYIFRNKLRKKKFPLVLMLEPLHACNLTCTGCGRIREYVETIRDMLSVDECVKAVEECGAPIVSICGGEPLIYPKIGELTRRLLDMGKFIYLSTNGMIIQKKIEKGELKPHRRFFWNVHLDGMEKTHDICVEKEGIFRQAVEGIAFAKKAGFQVCTNTTVYRETDMAEIEEMYRFLEPYRLDGHMLSPGYSYQAVQQKELFMTREVIHEKFKDVDRLAKRYNLHTTPPYLEFLQGKRDFPCAAWGNPTRNILGWKGPCYLITDAHHQSFQDLLDKTPWENYGKGNDPRCQDCMVYCCYEPAVALGHNKKSGDLMKYIRWQMKI
ncbi:MAG: adenosyl-hopene transferase HpnH [Candidatus Aminicenantes bacterium]|nr:adenosyl-hopene transferase HpnH [Candidatus Aminicenantes bacterium]